MKPLFLLLLFPLLGCGRDGELEPANDGLILCADEPIPHDVTLQGCADDEDCPIGTQCIPAEVSAAGEQLQDRCAVLSPPPSFRNRLQEGFGVPAFNRAKLVQLANESGAPVSVLEWEAPKGARVTACALFTCPPVFSTDETVGVRIDNFDRCVALLTTSTQQNGTFDPKEPSASYNPPSPDIGDSREWCCGVEGMAAHLSCLGEFSAPSISTLLAGCWAYDDWSLIAATELFGLKPGDMFDSKDVLAGGANGTCSVEDEGRNCWIESLGTFGVCELQSCRRRCLEGQECEQSCALTDPGTIGTCAGVEIGTHSSELVELGTCHCEVQP